MDHNDDTPNVKELKESQIQMAADGKKLQIEREKHQEKISRLASLQNLLEMCRSRNIVEEKEELHETELKE